MRTYLQMLVWMMLFACVIEMIFPESNYRKYIKLVLGCILICTMVTPVMEFLKAPASGYKDYVLYYQNRVSGGAKTLAEYEAQKQAQEALLKEYYETGIKETVETQFEVKVQSIALDYEEDCLLGMHLVVGKQTTGKIEIGTIKIGDKSETVEGDTEKLKNKIKTCLSDFYNVQVCNIHITVQKN